MCDEREVRLTPQRRKVLELVCAADGPIGAYDILDRLRQSIGNPAPPTVYRALDFLLEQGLIHKLESLHAFVGCSHPDHPHASQFLICSDCGDVSEIENSEIVKSLRQAQETTGFKAKRPWWNCLAAALNVRRQSSRTSEFLSFSELQQHLQKLVIA